MPDASPFAVQFVPGSSTALVSERFVALLALEPSDHFVRLLSDLLFVEESLSQRMLDLLFDSGIDGLPDFALVVREGRGGRALVRGTGRIEVMQHPDMTSTYRGTGLLTWNEQWIERCDLMQLCIETDRPIDFDGTLYAASSGVLPADGIQVVWSDEPVVRRPRTSAVGRDRVDGSGSLEGQPVRSPKTGSGDPTSSPAEEEHNPETSRRPPDVPHDEAADPPVRDGGDDPGSGDRTGVTPEPVPVVDEASTEAAPASVAEAEGTADGRPR